MIWYFIFILLIAGIYLIYTSKWKQIYDFFFAKEPMPMPISSRSPSPLPQHKYARAPQNQMNYNISFRNTISASSIISNNNSKKKNFDLRPKFLTNANQNSSPILPNRNYSCDNQNSNSNNNNRQNRFLKSSNSTYNPPKYSEIPSGFHYYEAAYEDPVGLQSGYKFIQEKSKAKNEGSNEVPEKASNIKNENDDTSKESHHKRKRTHRLRRSNDDGDENSGSTSHKHRHRSSSSNTRNRRENNSNEETAYNSNNRSNKSYRQNNRSNKTGNYNNRNNFNFQTERKPKIE